MSETGKAFYWAVTGAVLGIGVIAILSIGIFLLALGVGLVIFGALRLRNRHLWVVVGFGAAPALILWNDIRSSPPPCPASGILTTTVSCGTIPASYTTLATIFTAIAGAGLALIAVQLLFRRLVASPR